MVKRKSKRTSSQKSSPYRKEIFSLMSIEKKDIAEKRVRDKGILIGKKGYNVQKLKKEYKKEKIKQALEKTLKGLSKISKKNVISRKILKPNKMTITINNVEPESYKPIYFKEELENEKRSMFFS